MEKKCTSKGLNTESMEIKFSTDAQRKLLPVELLISKPHARVLRAVVPCNYIRLPLKRQHNRAFLKSVPLLLAVFFEHIFIKLISISYQ